MLELQNKWKHIGHQILFNNQPVYIGTIHHGQQNVIRNIQLLQTKPLTSTAQSSCQLPSISTFYPQNNIFKVKEDYDKWIHWKNGTAVNHLGGISKQGRPLPKDVREKIVQLDAQGRRKHHIAYQLKITPQTVYRILKRYHQTGSIEPTIRKGTGCPKKKCFFVHPIHKKKI